MLSERQRKSDERENKIWITQFSYISRSDSFIHWFVLLDDKSRNSLSRPDIRNADTIYHRFENRRDINEERFPDCYMRWYYPLDFWVNRVNKKKASTEIIIQLMPQSDIHLEIG